METTTDAAPARLWATPSWLVTQTGAHAHRLVSQKLSTVDAHRYDYLLLCALEEFGPTSQAALGRHCGIDRSDIVALVNELAGRGMVERAPDPTDRRRNTITITPAGTRQLRRIDAAVAEVQDALFAPLSAVERDQLTRLLRKVLDYHGRPTYYSAGRGPARPA